MSDMKSTVDNFTRREYSMVIPTTGLVDGRQLTAPCPCGITETEITVTKSYRP
jgi:hypothetical protein